MKLKLKVIGILLLGLPLFFGGSCVKEGKSDDDTINYINTGAVVPEFTIYDSEGEPVDFDAASFAGKRTLLIFFWTSCSTCKEELPKIEEAWETLRDEAGFDFQLLAIARGPQDTFKKVEDYWDDNSYDMPWYLDPEREAFEKFANQTVPRTYIVDETGTVRWMRVGGIGGAGPLINKIRNLK